MIGLHIMRPTSIVVAGGGTETASVRAEGGVDFANATSLSLNGVFTAGYDNYMIVVRHLGSVSDSQFLMRLRASGTDASGTDYTRQYIVAANTTISAARATSETSMKVVAAGNLEGGDIIYIYGPHLAQPTAARQVNLQPRASVNPGDALRILDHANTHSLSTSYDGFTFIQNGAISVSGMVTVYGYAQ